MLHALPGDRGDLRSCRCSISPADTFDGVYTGKRVLTKALSLNCEPSDDVSVTIQGGAVTFTNSVLRDFSITFNLHQDGSFGLVSAVIAGNAVQIRGRIVGDVLEADVSNGPCEHHWRLTKNPP